MRSQICGCDRCLIHRARDLHRVVAVAIDPEEQDGTVRVHNHSCQEAQDLGDRLSDGLLEKSIGDGNKCKTGLERLAVLLVHRLGEALKGGVIFRCLHGFVLLVKSE
jgi:hypothetical protein